MGEKITQSGHPYFRWSPNCGTGLLARSFIWWFDHWLGPPWWPDLILVTLKTYPLWEWRWAAVRLPRAWYTLEIKHWPLSPVVRFNLIKGFLGLFFGSEKEKKAWIHSVMYIKAFSLPSTTHLRKNILFKIKSLKMMEGPICMCFR
jgi:hypothetical protein